MLSLRRYSPTKLCDGAHMAIFCVLYFPRAACISDLHSKFALRPHHVWKYGGHPICDGENRRGKKKKPQDENRMACPIGRP